MMALERLIHSRDPSLDPNWKIWIRVWVCLCLRGYRASYIGRWDEPEPSDQIDFDLRWILDLKAVGNRRSKRAVNGLWPRLADLGPGRPTSLRGLLAQVSSESFLVFSIIFWSWCRGRICFLARHPRYLALFSYLIPGKHWFTKTRGILSV
jgi:hypothetical protein